MAALAACALAAPVSHASKRQLFSKVHLFHHKHPAPAPAPASATVPASSPPTLESKLMTGLFKLLGVQV